MKSSKAKVHRNHSHHHTVKKTKSIGAPSIALLIFLAIVVIGLGAVILGKDDLKSLFPFLKSTPEQEIAMTEASPTPRPKPRPLNPGKETLKYSPGPMVVGPKISEFSLNPLDSKVGQTQTITVKLSYTGPVTSVTARLDTDNKKSNLTFTRVDGTDSNGTWQATRVEDDTHDYTYYLDFTLVGSPDTYNGGFAFR